MSPRLASRIEVSALIRRVEGAGGHAAVLARGDGDAGAILLFLADRGTPYALLERVLAPDGGYHWQKTGPQNIGDSEEVNHYIMRRRNADDDLWVVELDIAGVERFADEMIAKG